ncbi:AMP-binding protein [bacterium]|nr:AMP-binding protein [bacterium]
MTDRPSNIVDLLIARANGDTGDSPAIYWAERSLTWKAVELAAREVAGGLQNIGIGKGDRVAVLLPNVPPYLFLQYAVHFIGAILVPIHELTPPDELSYLLEDSEAKALFSWGDFQERIHTAIEGHESLQHHVVVGSSGSDPYDVISWMEGVEAYEGEPVGGLDDTALIRYTAGVTGRPKGAMLSHGNILYASEETHRELKVLAKDTVLGAIPFYHPFGSTLQLQMLLPSGAALLFHNQFDGERAFNEIREKRASVFIGLPMHFAALLDAAGEEETRTLRFAVSSGGPLDQALLARFERQFNTHIATIYGTCETSPTIAINPAHREDTPRDALGRVLSGTDVRIVDESNEVVPTGEIGEIVVKGPGVFSGYWNRPNATSLAMDAEGWFHSSDIGYMDIDGWLFGKGRLHDRINKGGFSVYPREVELVLNAHPAVHASVVIGVPDSKMGEEIAAFVVARPDMSVEEEELKNYCSERLARFKAPTHVITVDAIPRSPNGSLKRRELKERWHQEHSR